MRALGTLWQSVWASASPAMVLLFVFGVIVTIDVYLPPGRAVIVLFILVVILAGAISGPRLVVASVIAGALATIGEYFLRHGFVFFPSYVARRLFCIGAVLATGVLVSRNQAVQRRRRALATLLDLTGDAMFVRSIDDRITWWNHWAERLYGWSRTQVLGRTVGELIGDGTGQNDQGATGAAMAEMARNGAWEGELRHRLSDGRKIDVLSRWALQTDSSGRSIGILETNTDITREKAVVAELRGSEDRHRQIFETGGAAIWEADHAAVLRLFANLRADGVTDLDRYLCENPACVLEALDLLRVIDVNQTGLTMFQATAKDQLLQPLRRIFPAGAITLFRGLLAAETEGSPSFDFETKVKTLLGETKTVLISVTFPTARFTNLLLCMIDVTERRRAEAGLRQAQDELALAARVATLGELTSSVAQDVDRPVAEIGRHAAAALDALRAPGADIHTACDPIERVVSEGRHAAAVITRVRDFLRGAATRKQALELNAVVEAAVALTRHELADRQIVLHLELAPGLPMLDGDGPGLEHVVVNLILNGIESLQPTPADSRLLRIETDLQGVELILRVMDNGRLCPSVGLDRLFEPVFTTRSDGTRRDIGLAVCRASVEAHRGRIWATPADTCGTIVHVALPAPDRMGR